MIKLDTLAITKKQQSYTERRCMNKVMLAMVASGVQAMIVLIGLSLFATKFDKTELQAISIAWPALAVMEYVRCSADNLLRPRLMRILATIVSVLCVVTVGAFTWTAAKYYDLAGAVKAKSAADILIQYSDTMGRLHRIDVPREPNESPFQHRDRAASFVRYMEEEFPRKDS